MRMTKVVAVAAVLTFFLGAPAMSQSLPPVVSAPRVPQIGDSATIKLSNETVTRAYLGREGDLNCFSEKSSAGESKLCSTQEGNLVRRTGVRPLLFTPHSGLLSFPISVGKQWEHDYVYTYSGQAGGQTSNRHVRANVVSYDRISVGAGTFDAFKVEATVTWTGGGYRGIYQQVYYYAPGVGVIKYDVSGSDVNEHTELMNYTRAK